MIVFAYDAGEYTLSRLLLGAGLLGRDIWQGRTHTGRTLPILRLSGRSVYRHHRVYRYAFQKSL
jgi:hypothetical protein